MTLPSPPWGKRISSGKDHSKLLDELVATDGSWAKGIGSKKKMMEEESTAY